MTLVSTIISDAFRQSNLTAIGVSPTSLEQTEGLRYLNRILKSVFGNEAGEALIPFPIGSANIERPAGWPWYDTTPDNEWFIPKNFRLMLNLDTTIPPLYLHPVPDDGTRFAVIDVTENLATYPITINGNGRRIEDATSITLNVNGTDSEWFYRADLGNWLKYAPLEADDVFPFPEEFDDFFITMLAIRLNPSFGIALDPQSEATLRRSRSQLRARYHQNIEVPSEAALWRLSRLSANRDQWINNYWYSTTQSMFDKGWPY